MENMTNEPLKKGDIRLVNDGKALLIDLEGLAEQDSAADKLEAIYEILKAVRDGRNALRGKAL